ncbi:MAG: polysaccharide deacetylase family protein [Patescibacteria group bacterium]
MLWANFFHIYQPPGWPKKIIDKVVRESYRPILAILKKYPRLKITLNITGSLTEQLAAHGFQDVIKNIRQLSQQGKIELVGSAMYHPILPLLPEHEIERQIRLNDQINGKYFGPIYRPTGFFPPEMAYGPVLNKIIKRHGYRWLIIDEIASNGFLGQASFDRTHSIKGSSLQVIFRNRKVSDFLSFQSHLGSTAHFWKTVSADNRSRIVLVTGMDGENLGHHRPGLDSYWAKLATHGSVTTVTVSELLKQIDRRRIVAPRQCSWSSQERELKHRNPFSLWQDPTNPIHKLQWKMIYNLISIIEQHKSHPKYAEARQNLDKQLASDQMWWASAKPWWSLDIITRKTNELFQTALFMEPGNRSLISLAEKIIKQAAAWQKKNTYLTIATKYLATNRHDNIRYIGGKKITIS